MDYQNRAGSKFGGGGVASASATNADRRERLRKIAMENIDLEKDPYFFRNHVGAFECRLCLTVHQNDGSYLAHTQGKKHQTNLARRQAREDKQREKEGGLNMGMPGVQIKKQVVKIGVPGYTIQKLRDPDTGRVGLKFQMQMEHVQEGTEPKIRFMSSFEQQVDADAGRGDQFCVIHAEPYNTVGFKIHAGEIDRHGRHYFTWWNKDTKIFYAQFMYKDIPKRPFDGFV